MILSELFRCETPSIINVWDYNWYPLRLPQHGSCIMGYRTTMRTVRYLTPVILGEVIEEFCVTVDEDLRPIVQKNGPCGKAIRTILYIRQLVGRRAKQGIGITPLDIDDFLGRVQNRSAKSLSPRDIFGRRSCRKLGLSE